jgi:rod shape-determining protein MreD
MIGVLKWAGLALLLEAVRLVFFGRLPIQPDFLLGMVVVLALLKRPPTGAVAGFGLGVLRDLLYGSPIGIEALPLTLIGWGAGSLGRTMYRESPLTQGVIILAAGLFRGALLYLVLRGGQADGLFAYVFRIALPSAAVTALLVPPAVAAVQAWRERRRRQPIPIPPEIDENGIVQERD